MSKIPKLSRSRASSADRCSNVRTSGLARSRSQLGMKSSETPLRNSKSAANDMPWSSANKGLLNINKVKAKDTRLLQDKQWQAAELTKVQAYLQSVDGGRDLLHHGTNLRPLTTNMFVQICNLLLKKVDSRISITMANYVDELQNILKKLKYPGTLSKTLMVTANVPRNWSAILGIIGWLVDVVRMFEELVDIELLDTQFSVLSFVSQCYLRWLKLESYDDLLQEYVEEVRKSMQKEFDVENLEREQGRLKLKIAKIDKERDRLKEEEHKFMQFTDLTTKVQQECIDFEQVINEQTHKNKNLENEMSLIEKQLLEKELKIEQLQEQIGEQPLNISEHLALQNSCKDLENDIQRLEAIQQDLSSFSWSLNEKIELKTEKITSLADTFGRDLLKFTLMHPEHKTVVMPEINLREPANILKGIQNLKTNIQEVRNELHAKNAEKEELIAMQESKIKEKQTILDEKTSKLKEFKDKNEFLEREFTNFVKNAEISEKESKLKDIKRQMADFDRYEPKIEKAHAELNAKETEITNWKIKEKEDVEKIRPLFENLFSRATNHCEEFLEMLPNTIEDINRQKYA